MTMVESKDFRKTLGTFATGVTVVSFFQNGQPAGMTVNSFASVSLEPPLVLFCPNLSCRFSEDLTAGKRFAVSVLNADQKDVCLHFAGRPSLTKEPWLEVEAGAPPIIEGCLSWLSCRLDTAHRHGDHWIVVASVEDVGTGSGSEPLLFFRGDYPSLADQS